MPLYVCQGGSGKRLGGVSHPQVVMFGRRIRPVRYLGWRQGDRVRSWGGTPFVVPFVPREELRDVVGVEICSCFALNFWGRVGRLLFAPVGFF